MSHHWHVDSIMMATGGLINVIFSFRYLLYQKLKALTIFFPSCCKTLPHSKLRKYKLAKGGVSKAEYEGSLWRFLCLFGKEEEKDIYKLTKIGIGKLQTLIIYGSLKWWLKKFQKPWLTKEKYKTTGIPIKLLILISKEIHIWLTRLFRRTLSASKCKKHYGPVL